MSEVWEAKLEPEAIITPSIPGGERAGRVSGPIASTGPPGLPERLRRCLLAPLGPGVPQDDPKRPET
eukprot:4043385-Pyramimonas_sp.AAC.1